MKLTLLSFTALVPINIAFAQTINATYLTGLGQALSAAGLNQLAVVAAAINGTAIGQQLLVDLPTRNWTIFAPDDAARAFAYSISFIERMLVDPFYSEYNSQGCCIGRFLKCYYFGRHPIISRRQRKLHRSHLQLPQRDGWPYAIEGFQSSHLGRR